MIDPKVLESIGALEKRVIIPTCDVRSELEKMHPQEAREAKRKWRKLRKRVHRKMKNLGLKESHITKKATIYQIRFILREVGKEKIGM